MKVDNGMSWNGLAPGTGISQTQETLYLLSRNSFWKRPRFGNTGVIITIGYQGFREQYVKELVEGWVKEAETLESNMLRFG